MSYRQGTNYFSNESKDYLIALNPNYPLLFIKIWSNTCQSRQKSTLKTHGFHWPSGIDAYERKIKTALFKDASIVFSLTIAGRITLGATTPNDFEVRTTCRHKPLHEIEALFHKAYQKSYNEKTAAPEWIGDHKTSSKSDPKMISFGTKGRN